MSIKKSPHSWWSSIFQVSNCYWVQSQIYVFRCRILKFSNLISSLVLLAHNGFVYDFPLLYAEIQRRPTLKYNLLDGIYFADTLLLLRNVSVTHSPHTMLFVQFPNSSKTSLVAKKNRSGTTCLEGEKTWNGVFACPLLPSWFFERCVQKY